MAEDTAAHGRHRGNWLLERLPPDIRTRLTPEVSAAIAEAAAQGSADHNVDIRLSLPLPLRRFYLAVLAGQERRSPERREADRRRNLIRVANVLFVIAVGILFYAGYRLVALLVGTVFR